MGFAQVKMTAAVLLLVGIGGGRLVSYPALGQGMTDAGAMPVVKDELSRNITPLLPEDYEPSERDYPDRAAMLRALPRNDPGIPGVYEVLRDDFEFSVECIVNKLHPPRFYPLVGPARLRNLHYKCVVCYTETITYSFLFPFEVKRRRAETLYIDRDCLHLVANPPAPTETPKVTLPPYTVAPPDILQINATVCLKKHPVFGPHLVRPDGTVSIGAYGAAYVAGLTLDEAKQAIARVIYARLNQKKKTLEDVIAGLSVDVAAYNSSVYYVITDRVGFGEIVVRLPITDDETVLDAVSKIDGVPAVASKCRIWVARRDPDNHKEIVLPVDWRAITQRGVTATNYQLLPGDRVYLKIDKATGR